MAVRVSLLFVGFSFAVRACACFLFAEKNNEAGIVDDPRGLCATSANGNAAGKAEGARLSRLVQ